MCDAYCLGRVAFIEGRPEDSNPFPTTQDRDNPNQNRMSWFDGFFDARTDKTLERLSRLRPLYARIDAVHE